MLVLELDKRLLLGGQRRVDLLLLEPHRAVLAHRLSLLLQGENLFGVGLGKPELLVLDGDHRTDELLEPADLAGICPLDRLLDGGVVLARPPRDVRSQRI